MMKQFLLFLMVFCLGQVFLLAQEKEPRFRLELSGQSILTKGNYLVVSPVLFYDIAEKTVNYSTHLSGFLSLGPQLELGLGLGYANRDIYARDGFCALNPCERPGIFELGGYKRIRSLEMPLELRWKYLKSAERFNPYLSFALVNRIPILNRRKAGVFKNRLRPGEHSMGLVLGAGIQVALFEKWSLILAAQVRKHSNFNFDKYSYHSIIIRHRWFNEAAIKIGIGRSF